MEFKRTNFKLEVNICNVNNIVRLPCGFKPPGFIILEDIWIQTGCDIPGERGHWICPHCDLKYFFYLYQK